KKDDKKDDDDDDDNDDRDDHALIITRRTGSSKDIKERVAKVLLGIVPKIASNATNDLISDNLTRVMADAIKKEREGSKANVPALISKEFDDHAPKIIEELFKIHMKNSVINVHPITSTSTTTTTADLQHTLYLKMKSSLQDQVDDHELCDVLKCKFEKFSASSGPCRTDAFRKRDHDDHQEDDAPPKGEKIIDEDEVIPEDETHKLIEGFQNVDKHLPTLFDHERIEATLRDMMRVVLMGESSRLLVGIRKLPDQDQLNRTNVDPYSILDKPTTGLINLNNKEEKRVMNLVDIVKFCDAMLERVLKQVKLKIFETEFLMKALLLGELDLDKMKAYERQITKHLRHREQMRRWESFKYFNIEKKQLLIENDRLLEESKSCDIMWTILCFVKDFASSSNFSCLFIDNYAKCECLETDLFNQRENIDNKSFNELSKQFAKLKEYSISHELSLQHYKEKMIFNELKQLATKLKGKGVNTQRESLSQKTEDENELLEQARALKPLGENLDYACKFAQRIQELLVCDFASCAFALSENEKWAPVKSDKKKNKPYVDTSSTRELVVNNAHRYVIKWKQTRRIFNTVEHRWLPTGRNFSLVGNQCPLTKITPATIVPSRNIVQTTRILIVALKYQTERNYAKARNFLTKAYVNSKSHPFNEHSFGLVRKSRVLERPSWNFGYLGVT
ncbi:hypothetical protein Tco_0550226, partial [Tanacetum coccineum]